MWKYGLVILTFSILSHASWNPLSKKIINQSSKEYYFDAPSGFVSLWGGIKRKFSSFKSYAPNIKVSGSKYFENEVTLFLSQRDRRLPLSIFFPGIFGDINGDLTPIIINTFDKEKTHLLVIPNFLSKRYLSFKPRYNKGVQEQAMDAAISLIESTIKRIGQKNISQINLVGESLGTFVATTALSELSNKEDFKKINFKLMLLWPPLEVAKVVKNFDEKFKQTQKIYNQCNFIYQFIVSGYYFFGKNILYSPPKDFVNCMDSFLYHGTFGKSIKENLKFKNDIFGKEHSKEPQSFAEFFELFDNQLYKNITKINQKMSLSYWLAKRAPNTQVYLISSKDDFLNNEIDWKTTLKKSKLEHNDLILMDWGGHCAGLALPVWEEVFKLELL